MRNGPEAQILPLDCLTTTKKLGHLDHIPQSAVFLKTVYSLVWIKTCLMKRQLRLCWGMKYKPGLVWHPFNYLLNLYCAKKLDKIAHCIPSYILRLCKPKIRQLLCNITSAIMKYYGDTLEEHLIQVWVVHESFLEKVTPKLRSGECIISKRWERTVSVRRQYNMWKNESAVAELKYKQ